jgi:Bacterial Ig-like domain (group 3)
MNCRGLRLELVAGLGIALAMLALPGTAANAQTAPTQTTLAVTTGGAAGQAHATVTVTEQSGAPASGIVAIEEGNRQLASMVLNKSGQANANIDLPAGQHTLRAVYQGDAALQASVSRAQAATTTTTSSAPDFQVTVSSLQPSSTLAAGNAGTAIVTVTPVNNAALTSPMFITMSCSGLPNQSSCTFTPSSLEIVSTTPTSCNTGAPAAACPPTASMVIQTVAPGTATKLVMPARPGQRPSNIDWAFLFPGVLGLGGLAWGTRRRRWLSRMLMLAAVGVVTVMGATACNPQYYYYNHGQPTNPPTPAGSYTITVTAQSSNGITAITHSTTLAMTVK